MNADSVPFIPSRDNDLIGFTRQEYAAILLKQPTSGTPWLDEMILEAKRDELAGHALAGMMANVEKNKMFKMDIVANAYSFADCMLGWKREMMENRGK